MLVSKIVDGLSRVSGIEGDATHPCYWRCWEYHMYLYYE